MPKGTEATQKLLNVDLEHDRAWDAIVDGADRKKVRERFKTRFGRDLRKPATDSEVEAVADEYPDADSGPDTKDMKDAIDKGLGYSK